MLSPRRVDAECAQRLGRYRHSARARSAQLRATPPCVQGPLRTKFRSDCEHFIPIGAMSDEAAALHINELGMHIVADYNLYSAGRPHIFAFEPAPIQINFHDHPTTSGARYLHLVHTDRITSPPDYAAHYSEKLLYMPHSFVASSHKISGLSTMQPHEKATLKSELGFAPNAVVFCSFNQAQASRLRPPARREYSSTLLAQASRLRSTRPPSAPSAHTGALSFRCRRHCRLCAAFAEMGSVYVCHVDAHPGGGAAFAALGR